MPMKHGPRIFRDGMAQRNGDPIEDVPDEMPKMADAIKDDPVNHPSHYTEGHRIEVIEFLEDWMLPFHLSNCIKYICRAGRKNPARTIEDLEKGRWYLNRYIELLKAQEKKEGSV